METLDAIQTRRSIRQFTDDAVEDHLIEQIIKAGMMAPSAGNEQPWHFVVLRNKETLQAISRDHPFASAVAKATVAVLVCGDLAQDKYQGYWVQDCAAATQNMLLAAHDLGLASVWIGIHPREQRLAHIRSLIALPESIVPVSLLPIGYSAEEKGRENRFNPARIHHEKW